MLRGVDLELLVHGDHYPAVIERVLEARRSVWIATANLKELMIEDPRLVPGRRRGRKQFRSVLAALEGLSSGGVELRILHAAPPSRVFRRDFDRQKRLIAGGLELRLCPRTHLKLVIVDGRHLYMGSANWTGAGLGAKHDQRRNFELGLLTQDERLLDAAQEVFERVWRGGECADCRMRELCPMPLAAFERTKPAAHGVVPLATVASPQPTAAVGKRKRRTSRALRRSGARGKSKRPTKRAAHAERAAPLAEVGKDKGGATPDTDARDAQPMAEVGKSKSRRRAVAGVQAAADGGEAKTRPKRVRKVRAGER